LVAFGDADGDAGSIEEVLGRLGDPLQARNSFLRRKLTSALAVCRSIAASRSSTAASSCRSSSAIRC